MLTFFTHCPTVPATSNCAMMPCGWEGNRRSSVTS